MRSLSTLALGSLAVASFAQPALIPLPQQLEWKTGSFELKGSALEKRITTTNDNSLPDSGYRIEVTPSKIAVASKDKAGAFYALQTLKQATQGDKIPCFTATDSPRFRWRGMHLDVSRHFFTVDYIKRQLDWMANLKMNVFHWHITDDGGWRMQVDAYPKLTEIGAWRVDTGGEWPGGEWNQGALQFLLPGMTEKRYGGFYTKKEIRDVVAYAKERHITVVPEIELPGHQLPALVSHPELGCDGVLPTGIPGKNNTNVFCAGKETTFQFLEKVLDETLELFPSKWIHIGGDEVWKGHWANCSSCQARMKAENLKDVDELQSYFIHRIEKFLNSKGRSMVGWDEILEGGLAPNATVMSWRGIEGGIAAAKSGHDVVMSPTSHCYFDYPYNNISVERVYSYDPVPAELNAEEGKRVLGVQGNVWTEWIPTEDHAEAMTFPRALAMAEIGWTQLDRKDTADFMKRADAFIPWMAERKIDFMMPGPPLNAGLEFMEAGKPLTLSLPTTPNLTLRYTTNGTEPDAKSPVASSTMTVNEPGNFRFAYFDPSGRRGTIANLSILDASVTAEAENAIPGYLMRTRAAANEKKMPTFAAGDAVESVSEIAPLPGDEENYGLRFGGYLRIATPGVYTLYLTSDDGSNLYLAGAKLIDNDGLHGAVEKKATLRLPKGDFPLRIEFFQALEAARLKVEIEGPGIPRQDLKGNFIAMGG